MHKRRTMSRFSDSNVGVCARARIFANISFWAHLAITSSAVMTLMCSISTLSMILRLILTKLPGKASSNHGKFLVTCQPHWNVSKIKTESPHEVMQQKNRALTWIIFYPAADWPLNPNPLPSTSAKESRTYLDYCIPELLNSVAFQTAHLHAISVVDQHQRWAAYCETLELWGGAYALVNLSLSLSLSLSHTHTDPHSLPCSLILWCRHHGT